MHAHKIPRHAPSVWVASASGSQVHRKERMRRHHSWSGVPATAAAALPPSPDPGRPEDLPVADMPMGVLSPQVMMPRPPRSPDDAPRDARVRLQTTEAAVPNCFMQASRSLNCFTQASCSLCSSAQARIPLSTVTAELTHTRAAVASSCKILPRSSLPRTTSAAGWRGSGTTPTHAADAAPQRSSVRLLDGTQPVRGGPQGADVITLWRHGRCRRSRLAS